MKLRTAFALSFCTSLLVGGLVACSDPDVVVGTDSGTVPSTDSSSVPGTDSDTSTPSDSSTPATLTKEQFCAQSAARHLRCSDAAARPCNDKLYTCINTFLLPGPAAIANECFSNRACGKSDDGCVQSQAVAADSAFRDSCLAKRTACQADGGWGFSDDNCFTPLSVLKPASAAAYEACFQKPCDEIRTCVAAFLAGAGCDD